MLVKLKRNYRGFTALTLILILLIIGRQSIPICLADMQWNDDFNDGDSDGWIANKCTVENGSLLAVDSPAIAYRESTVTTGTWSFDLKHLAWSEANRPSGQLSGYIYNSIIYFMSTNPEELPRRFYCLVAGYVITDEWNKPAYTLRKSAGLGGDIGAWPLLASWDGIEFGWYHFDITRDANGEIHVFMNGTMTAHVLDEDVKSSEYFIYSAYQNRALDNVVVSDTIDVVLGPSPLLGGVLVGGFCILIVIALKVRIRGKVNAA